MDQKNLSEDGTTIEEILTQKQQDLLKMPEDERMAALKADVEVKVELERELAQVISRVLENYGVSGSYIFNVRKDGGYCHEPVTRLRDRELAMPLWCLGSGSTTVERPYEINPV